MNFKLDLNKIYEENLQNFNDVNFVRRMIQPHSEVANTILESAEALVDLSQISSTESEEVTVLLPTSETEEEPQTEASKRKASEEAEKPRHAKVAKVAMIFIGSDESTVEYNPSEEDIAECKEDSSTKVDEKPIYYYYNENSVDSGSEEASCASDDEAEGSEFTPDLDDDFDSEYHDSEVASDNEELYIYKEEYSYEAPDSASIDQRGDKTYSPSQDSESDSEVSE